MSSIDLPFSDMLRAKKPINLQKERTKPPPVVYFPVDNRPGSMLLYYQRKAE